MDTTASDIVEDLDEALNGRGVSLVFAQLKDPVRRKIERYGLTRTIDLHHFFPTIDAFRDETGARGPLTASPSDGQAATGHTTAGIVPPRDIPAPPAAG